MTNEEFERWLKTESGGNCIEVKFFDGFYAAAKPLLFHYTMIIGVTGDTCCFEKRYCYQTKEGVLQALAEWDGVGDPAGWHRSPETGRRRPDGNPTQEYIAW